MCVGGGFGSGVAVSQLALGAAGKQIWSFCERSWLVVMETGLVRPASTHLRRKASWVKRGKKGGGSRPR